MWGLKGKKKKKKWKPNSLAIPQQLVLVWKPAGLRWRVLVWGKASWGSALPAQQQAACLGTHTGCEVGTVSPSSPSEGKGVLEMLLERTPAVAISLGQDSKRAVATKLQEGWSAFTST